MPPAHRVRLVSSAPDGEGVSAEMIQRGGPEHYTVSYDVTNHRDSIAFAHLIWAGQDSVAASDKR